MRLSARPGTAVAAPLGRWVPLVWQCADKTVTVFVVSALGRFLK